MSKTAGLWIAFAGLPLWGFLLAAQFISFGVSAPDETITLPDCTDSLFYTYTFQLSDPDGDFDPAEVLFDGGGSGLELSDIQILPGGQTAEGTATGWIVEGSYTLAISFRGETAQPHLEVLSQPDSTPPVLVYPAGGLLAQVSSCDGNTAVFSFAITATDNCDADPNLTVQLIQGQANLIALGPPGQFLLIAGPGSYELLLTATDAAGNIRQENLPVEVEAEPVPSPNLGCNDTVRLAQNTDCALPLTADLLLEGAFGCLQNLDFTIQLADADPSNGPVLDGTGYFPFHIAGAPPALVRGLNGPLSPAQWSQARQGNASATLDTGQIILEADYALGNRQIAYWTAPRSGSLSLDWALQDDAGSASLRLIRAAPLSLTTELDQTGTGAGTLQWDVRTGEVVLLSLEALQNDSGSATARCFNWRYQPDSLSGFGSCEGVLLAEDKSPPGLDCPADTENGIRLDSIQFLSGSINSNDPSFVPSAANCFAGAGPGDFFFDTLSFQVNASGTYLLELLADWGPGRAALLQGSFYPTQPCPNFITGGVSVNNGTGSFPNASQVLRITAPLLAGKTYSLLTTTDTEGQTGNYTWHIFGGPGKVNGLSARADTLLVNLRCGDEELIFRQPESLAFTGMPTVTDNCSGTDLTFDDMQLASGDCGEQLIRRTFFATDAAGNSDTCEQAIRIPRLTVDDILLPPAIAFLECSDEFDLDPQGNPVPRATGRPSVLTLNGILPVDTVLCNLSAGYSDDPPIPVCIGSYKLVRQWLIVDECDPAASFIYPQQIFIGDVLGPTVSCSAGLDTIFTDKDQCTASFRVPLPQVTDNCSDWRVRTEIVTDTTLTGPDGNSMQQTLVLATLTENSPDRQVGGIPEGCHRIRYTVVDDCGNETVRECPFCVVDDKEPTATCNEFLQVTLDGDGRAAVKALDIDEGSWDNCGLAGLEVRREFRKDTLSCDSIAPFFGTPAPEAVFSCCDIGDTIRVELIALDSSGNANTCRAEVLVLDKVRPECRAPGPDTTNCLDLADDFDFSDTSLVNARFGRATATDNCSAGIVELPALDQRDACGAGLVIRQFRARDESGNFSQAVCTQPIVVDKVSQYDIRFPADETGFCGDVSPDSVFINTAGCDLLAVSMVADTLIVFDTECVKIERRFRVLDWCAYDGSSNPVVISRDEDGNGLPGDRPVWVLKRNDEAFVDGDADETNGFYRTADSRGFWEYTQLIKVVDTIPPLLNPTSAQPFCITDLEECLAEIDYFFTAIEDCTPSFVEVEAFVDAGNDGVIDTILGPNNILGRAPKFRFNAKFPEGQYELILILRDGCGNASTFEVPFEVVDCTAPAPACINGFAIELMALDEPADVDGDGIIDFFANTIQATDYIPSATPDCNEPVTYSIHRAGETPHPDSSSLTVTCADLGTLDVDIYAWDNAYNPTAVQPDSSLGGPNYGLCRSFLEVQSNLFPCDTALAFLGGRIATEVDQPVKDVQVQLSGLLPQTTYTDAEGIYRLTDLALGEDYTIFPSLDTDPLNGVSTFDLVRIQQHILNLLPLDSPYKRIAADANRSATITTADLVVLRRLILGLDIEVEGNTSWRFIEAAFTFPNPDDPWATPFPELININNLARSDDQLDFVAVKVGDVNNSAQTNSPLPKARSEQSSGPVALELADRSLQAGEAIAVPIYLPEGQHWEGIQFSLKFDPQVLALEGFQAGRAGPEHLNATETGAGRLSCSWDRFTGRNDRPDDPLFRLQFRAKRTGRLSEVLRLVTGPLAAEAYSETLDIHPVHLTFSASESGSGLRLDKPQPNPFSGQTTIPAFLPGEEEARLILRNNLGQAVREIPIAAGQSGHHQLLITSDMLPAAGVYFAELLQGKARAVQKLVRL